MPGTQADVIRAVQNQQVFMLHVSDAIDTINLNHNPPEASPSESPPKATSGHLSTALHWIISARGTASRPSPPWPRAEA